jgi:POT family proton-dependent oligopeptide transporter
MIFADRRAWLRKNFLPPFWVANVMELFERLAYYGQQVVFMVYLRDVLGYSESQAGGFSSVFGGVMWLFPIVAGTLADKWGFRRSFTIAFTMLGLGYFLIGSLGLPAFAGIYGTEKHGFLLLLFLLFTAVGGSFIKPSVLGTVAVTSTEEGRSLGFALYYWLVNLGALLGPTIAYVVRDNIGYAYVYLVSAISCAAMLVTTLIKYKDVKPLSGVVVETLAKKFVNLVVVLGNFRFMIFLLIYALYWIIFWQEYIVIPYYATDFIGKSAAYELVMSWGGAGAIVVLQIPLNWITKKLPTHKAILAGFAISSFIWVIIAIAPSLPMIAAGIVAFAIGEMIQAPRYYEYISEIAPPGQQALFQGYAFLPIALARFIGDPIGGWVYQTAKAEGHIEIVWFTLIGIGFLATALMALYNRFLLPRTSPAGSA